MNAAIDYEGLVVEVLDPAAANVDAAEGARQADMLEHLPPEARLQVTGAGVEPVPLSPGLVSMLATILREIGQGNVVALVATAEEVSTGVAARLLGVSRPHVAKLVDTGILPGRKLNRHRRVRAKDVLAYKRRREMLDELSAMSQEMGLY